MVKLSRGASLPADYSAKTRRDRKIAKRKELLESLNKANRKIKSGNLSGRNLVSQQKLKERLERQIQDIDKKSAGMLAATRSSPVVKAVNQAERIAASNDALAGLSDREKAKARIVTGKNNKDTLSQNPDVFPETGNQRTARMGQSTTGTRKAQPRSKPKLPFAGLLGAQRALKNTPRGSDAPLRVTPRSKETVDEYAEAFASPDADKMYNLSEKNRRKDMNMLERAFDSIKVAGDRATADRKKRGLSDYDMNEEFYSKKGGRVGATMKKTRKSSVRKRAAKRGFGVETRGN